MPIILQKSKDYRAIYTSNDFPALTPDWTGSVSFFKPYPAVCSIIKPLENTGEGFVLYLSVQDVYSLSDGEHVVETTIVNASLGITVTFVEYATVIAFIISDQPMTLITMTIGKVDGTPVGKEVTELQNIATPASTITSYQNVYEKVVDPLATITWKSTVAIVVTTAGLVVTSPTRSFATSLEAYNYTVDFFNVFAPVLPQGAVYPTRVRSVNYVAPSYVAFVTLTFATTGAFGGAGGVINEFVTEQECADFIEALMSDSHVDRTSPSSSSTAPTSSDVAYSYITTQVPLLISVPATSGLRMVTRWKGAQVKATIAAAFNSGTDIIGTETVTTETNAAGYAQLAVIKGSTVTVTCPSFGKSVTVDTTGLDTIDLSTYF